MIVAPPRALFLVFKRLSSLWPLNVAPIRCCSERSSRPIRAYWQPLKKKHFLSKTKLHLSKKLVGVPTFWRAPQNLLSKNLSFISKKNLVANMLYSLAYLFMSSNLQLQRTKFCVHFRGLLSVRVPLVISLKHRKTIVGPEFIAHALSPISLSHFFEGVSQCRHHLPISVVYLGTQMNSICIMPLE